MITRFTTMVIVGEVWCYLHGAQDLFPYAVGLAMITSIVDTVIKGVYK
jgi:hypothetical protein